MDSDLPEQRKKKEGEFHPLFFTERILERRIVLSKNVDIPFWEQYTLSVEEAAKYFRIGENKLRKIISENKDADYIIWNGNRAQIKRKLFEKYIDQCELV